VRVFDFPTGKLYRTYDESLATIMDMQQVGTALQRLDEVEFGRPLTVERELESPVTRPKINIIFDESGHFLLYGSLLGVKYINTFTNRVVKVFGTKEPFRALHLALYQGQPQKKGVITVSMAAGANLLLQEVEERDSMLATTGFAKMRFYLFTNQTEISKASRDVQNEKPQQTTDDGEGPVSKVPESGTSAILHTTIGDIHFRLFSSAGGKFHHTCP
jgi:peptidylprolyl isomerase domain and WD repeat-containing protein 1